MSFEHNEHNQHDLICEIFQQMANERSKTTKKIMDLFFLKQNLTIHYRFWEIVDKKIPNHTYTGVGCCPDCGRFFLD